MNDDTKKPGTMRHYRVGDSPARVGRGQNRRLQELALLALLAVTIFSFSKGAIDFVQPAAEGYWLINYDHGFVRRALLGQIFSFFQDQGHLKEALSTARYVHLMACALLLLGLLAWLRVALSRGSGSWLLAIFAIFATSQFLPTQAYDVGFLDVYDYVLVLGAAVAALCDLWALAGIIGLIGPFIHEGFIFVWLTLVVLILWQGLELTPQKIGTIFAPLVSTVIVYFAPTKHAGIAEMATTPLPQAMKDGFIAYQFGQTFSSSVHIILWKIINNWLNFGMAVAFFALPAAVIILACSITHNRLRDTIALILAALSPATILVVGWDLSRFLVATSFSSLLSVMYMQTVRPTKVVRLSAVISCWIFATVGAVIPFVYAYYEVAAVVDLGFIPLANTPIGHLVTSWVSFYSRNIGPRTVPEVGTEAPPGTVWYEEEDAMSNIWTRRPGTNVFDAVGSKGGMTVRCVLTISRGGDRIRVVRSDCSDGNNLMYSGTIEGSEIQGTYPGGKWYATIHR
jgi:hypothetical protein